MTESRHRARPDSRAGFLYPALLAWVAIAMGLVWYSPRDVRWGAALAGAGMLIAALGRLGLPASAAGMLATRQRYLDVAALAVLGLGTLVVGLLVPPPV
jgi:hypothetical protein